MTRKVGIEIEVAGDKDRILRQLRDVCPLTVDDYTHTHNTGTAPSNWLVKRDGSLDNCPGGGAEIVSPPLDFDVWEDRHQITQMVLALQQTAARTHYSAGIHVHCEATNADGTDFTAKQVAALVRFTYKYEDFIYRIASSGWQRHRGLNYCRPLPEATALAIMKARSHEDIQRIWNGQFDRHMTAELERYQALNLRSIWLRNTCEFRYFNSSLNPRRIQAYVALCQAIMEDARQGHSRQVKSAYRLGAMLNGQISEASLMLRMQQVLTTNSKDTHRLMDKEDWKTLRKVCWKDSVPQSRNTTGRNF